MYYNIDSPMGHSIMEQMRRALVDYAEGRGIQGDINLREIRPEDLGLTAQTITIAAGEATYTLTRDVKEGCAIVIGGWTVNDALLREVDVYKGTAMLHNWNIGNIYYMRDKQGVRQEYVMWARGDTLKLIFTPKATSTAAQVSNTWPIGWIIIPHMGSSATRASG